MANIMLVLRSGGDFHFRDVELLTHHIKQNNPIVKVYCLVDTIAEPIQLNNVKLIPLPYPEWPGWWSKMNLFSPELEQYRPFLFMDLDTACVGSIQPFVPPSIEENSFIMLRDFCWADRVASGFMWIPSMEENDKVSKVWEVWVKDPGSHINEHRGDQDFIGSVVSPDSIWQEVTPKHICCFKLRPSWNRKYWLTTVPAEASIICFYGNPRIWKIAKQVEWIRDYIDQAFVTINALKSNKSISGGGFQ